MFEQVICGLCQGNGCHRCNRNGVIYKEIDDPTLALHDEITELKRQLEIAKEALKNINVNDSALSGKWVSEYELRDIAKKAFEELESAGE